MLLSLQAMVPLGIISAALAAMGGLQGAIQKGFFGKPKPIGVDDFDRLLEKRDDRIRSGGTEPAS